MEHNIVTLGSYREFRDICHRIKHYNQASMMEAAARLSMILPCSDSVLIPIPSHTGQPSYMLDICRRISELSGITTLDLLCGISREPLYELKRSLSQPISKDFLGLHQTGDLPCGLHPILVDNVIATGLTMSAALDIFPDATLCSLAIDYPSCTLICP